MKEQLKLENEARTIRRDAADARCQAAGLCFEDRARLECFAEGLDTWAAELEEKAALLEERNRAVEHKNREVDLARAALEEQAKQLPISSKNTSEI